MERDHWLMNSGNANALVLFEGATDADGRVELRGPGGRDLGLCVNGPGHVPLRQSGIRLDAADEYVVHVSRGARLVGRIVPPEALTELKRLVGVGPDEGFGDRYRPRLEFTDGQMRRFPKDHVTASNLTSLRVQDDGSFDVDGLPPGPWKVVVAGWIPQDRGGASGHSFSAGDVQLVDGQTTHKDLDLEYVLPGTVEGLVLQNGEPLANGTVTLRTEDLWQNLQTDADGRFTKILFAGEYELFVQKQRGAHGWSRLDCPTRTANPSRRRTSRRSVPAARAPICRRPTRRA